MSLHAGVWGMTLFVNYTYVIGAYVQHIANTQGRSLDEVLDIARDTVNPTH